MAPHSSVLAWRVPGGAWGAAVYGVAQSQTRLKQLSSSSSSGVTWGFPVALVVRNPLANARDEFDP